MKRRKVIKNLLVICGTTWLIPACINEDGDQAKYFEGSWITNSDVKMMAEITEAIIPQTDTPGAKKLGIHLFVLTMVMDCMSKKLQEGIKNGLKEIDRYALKLSGKPFMQMELKLKQQLLSGNGANPPGDWDTFLTEVKRLTIQGYATSKYVMTNLAPYKLVPGHFYGCVKKANTK